VIRRGLAIIVVTLAVGARAARAQGTLSTQGFGYAPGQISAQALGLGGATAESDPLSTINDAALLNWGRSGVYFQATPEFRSVETPTGSDNTTTIRFPIFSGAFTAGSRLVFGVSSSTLLDRSWETSFTGYLHLPAGDSALYTQNFISKGGINDIRLAGAGAVTDWLHLGAGMHFFTGQNRLQVQALFVDSAFTAFQQTTNLSFSGTGVSAAIELRPLANLAIAGSYRHGGTISAYSGDTLLSHASIPDRYGGGISLLAWPVIMIAARAEFVGWSSMNGLATSTVKAVDSWEYDGGIELRGKSLIGVDMPIRLGYRQRTLPFQVVGETVTERSYSFGTALNLARGRSRIDFTVARADRSADVDVKEHGWIVAFGFLVRP